MGRGYSVIFIWRRQGSRKEGRENGSIWELEKLEGEEEEPRVLNRQN